MTTAMHSVNANLRLLHLLAKLRQQRLRRNSLTIALRQLLAALH
jgi:hypothetical protein